MGRRPYGTLDGGIVGGRVVGGIVATVEGTKVDDVGGGRVVSVVVVVSAGGSVVAVVVCTGGEVVPGATVPVLRGAVVTTGGWVVTVEPGAVVVEVGAVEEVDEVGALDVVVAREVEVVATVVGGDWVATCCLGDVSPPVATSNSRAARASVARAYSPVLKR